ncbi:methyltransferase type 11 [Richelia sinica FACHB-800]|uniref:Methyltransferase type 11 n=1 Tax=Richelia sinica FACHB-800 TaxID=1357546 RepID=A0A975Y480_9NOST|nr:class I SAM-dependent methyltransferase [Richelia sinica]MBD2663547.1 class I SAM-dependent methyltransferase [Richelia sinica FACHB-800]QXE22903.1 methyltransferase type 11 [Richelia sinica FACHB-800]
MYTITNNKLILQPYLTKGGVWDDGILTFSIPHSSPAMEANSYYFNQEEWAKAYLQYCHQDEEFRSLWQAAMGSWDGKIVVDVGCGPGNLLACLGGSPKLMIGVDIAKGSLKIAEKFGYVPILADAHNLPLVSGFADIVTLNATLHHCDDMGKVLAEAARLLKPGGILISDRDQQLSSMNFKGISALLWRSRVWVWRLLRKGAHASREHQKRMLATEIHVDKPGDGVFPELYFHTLEPMGFSVNVYPHNNQVGAAVLQGNYGKAMWHWRFVQRLSGINPYTPEAAMSLMCVARKK